MLLFIGGQFFKIGICIRQEMGYRIHFRLCALQDFAGQGRHICIAKQFKFVALNRKRDYNRIFALVQKAMSIKWAHQNYGIGVERYFFAIYNLRCLTVQKIDDFIKIMRMINIGQFSVLNVLKYIFTACSRVYIIK